MATLNELLAQMKADIVKEVTAAIGAMLTPQQYQPTITMSGSTYLTPTSEGTPDA